MPIYKMDGTKYGKTKYRVRINYVDSFGKNKQIDRVTYGIAEAKELERQLNFEIKESSPIKSITVENLFDEYIRVKQHEVRESSLNKTSSILTLHILPFLGSIKLKNINMKVLQAWKNDMEEKQISTKSGLKNLGVRTKQNAYGELRALLNYAVKMEYISQNPLLKIGNFKDVNTIKDEMQYYTPDEFKQYINAARFCAEKSPTNADWDYYVFFCIAFYMGLRKGEIHALKWHDISGEYLSVKRSITQKLKGEDRETPPKNKSSIRTIQMPKPLIDILGEHKERYKSLKGFNDDFRVCGGTRPLRDTSVENANIKFAKLASVKKIRIHDFRHSHASLLANNGINIQEIARRLGHANIEMTWNTYAHLYPREEERATQILDKIV